MPVRYPPAEWLETGTESQRRNDPRLDVVVGCILHVDGGNASTLKGWFDVSGGVESHLFFGNERHPVIEQYRDLEQEADANYLGNSWVENGTRYGYHSVETRGLAEGEWDPWQVEQIKAFLLWDSERFGYPLRVAPTYRSPGVGYHVMFGAGRDVLGWSNARGKVCPGPDRIRQFHDVITPWMRNPDPAPKEWSDVATEQETRQVVREEVAAAVKGLGVPAGLAEKIADVHRVLLRTGADASPAFADVAAAQARLDRSIGAQAQRDAELLAAVRDLAARVDALAPTTPTTTPAQEV